MAKDAPSVQVQAFSDRQEERDEAATRDSADTEAANLKESVENNYSADNDAMKVPVGCTTRPADAQPMVKHANAAIRITLPKSEETYCTPRQSGRRNTTPARGRIHV